MLSGLLADLNVDTQGLAYLKGCPVTKVYSFSTTNYWESPIIQKILRNYLIEHRIPEAGVTWILKDIAPRLSALSRDISVEVPEGSFKTAEQFVAALHKMTSQTLIEILKIEIDLYRAKQIIDGL